MSEVSGSIVLPAGVSYYRVTVGLDRVFFSPGNYVRKVLCEKWSKDEFHNLTIDAIFKNMKGDKDLRFLCSTPGKTNSMEIITSIEQIWTGDDTEPDSVYVYNPFSTPAVDAVKDKMAAAWSRPPVTPPSLQVPVHPGTLYGDAIIAARAHLNSLQRQEKRRQDFEKSTDLQESLSEILSGVTSVDADTEETKKFLTDRVCRISRDLLTNHPRLWCELEPNGRTFVIGVQVLDHASIKSTALCLDLYRTMVTDPYFNLIGCQLDSVEDIQYLYNAIVGIEKDLNN